MAQIVTAATPPGTEDAKCFPVLGGRPASTYTVRAAAVDANSTMDLVNDIRQALINCGLIK